MSKESIENNIIKNNFLNTALLKALPDSLFVFSKDGYLLDYHIPDNIPRFVDFDKLLKKNIREMQFNESVKQRLLSSISNSFETKEVQTIEFSFQVDEKSLYFESRLISISDNEVLIIERNITEDRKSVV